MLFKRKKERTKKNKINLICSAILLLVGLAMFILPWIKILDPVKILYVVFSIYALVKLVEYFLTRNGSDLENLYTAIASALAAISGFRFINYEPTIVLSMTLASWVAVMSIIKLIKLDYYHDRENGMLYVNLITFSLFILLGLLTSINLYFNETVQYIMLAFFFVVNGLLMLAENGIRILVTSKALYISDINK